MIFLMAAPVQQRLSFAISVLSKKNCIPLSNQKLKVHVIHVCVLHSNKYITYKMGLNTIKYAVKLLMRKVMGNHIKNKFPWRKLRALPLVSAKL